ncbi:signal recognition particle-docking protein FtsY [Psittacicella gerlachiana]|nr:signal recognition particle-docking protein FtsY [Psittacicella gerlachiana]
MALNWFKNIFSSSDNKKEEQKDKTNVDQSPQDLDHTTSQSNSEVIESKVEEVIVNNELPLDENNNDQDKFANSGENNLTSRNSNESITSFAHDLNNNVVAEKLNLETSEQNIEAKESSNLVQEADLNPEISKTSEQDTQVESTKAESTKEEAKNEEVKPKKGFFSRLVAGLSKTGANIGAGLSALFVGKKINKNLFEELEEHLLIADVGIDTTDKIIKNLTDHVKFTQLNDAQVLYGQLKQELKEIVEPCAQPLEIKDHKPFLILMIGVNGVGKTTTIGKLTKKLQQEGKSVVLAAADTFRAAAIEQLQEWGQRNNVPVISQKPGSDSAAVIYDAFNSAKAKGIDVVIADTAGRLSNKNHLLDELSKIVRVVQKLDPSAPHEVMITLDASTGQNAMSQVEAFDKAVNITGINLTKLDGTAKGGVIFAICDKFKKPIRYIGVGEKIDDLQPFNAEDFIEALFKEK